jgi:hypothetical protein
VLKSPQKQHALHCGVLAACPTGCKGSTWRKHLFVKERGKVRDLSSNFWGWGFKAVDELDNAPHPGYTLGTNVSSGLFLSSHPFQAFQIPACPTLIVLRLGRAFLAAAPLLSASISKNISAAAAIMTAASLETLPTCKHKSVPACAHFE